MHPWRNTRSGTVSDNRGVFCNQVGLAALPPLTHSLSIPRADGKDQAEGYSGHVRAGVPRPEDDGQALPGPVPAVIGPGGYGMKTKGLPPGRGGLLLPRMRQHDRGVKVKGDQAALRRP